MQLSESLEFCPECFQLQLQLQFDAPYTGDGRWWLELWQYREFEVIECHANRITCGGDEFWCSVVLPAGEEVWGAERGGTGSHDYISHRISMLYLHLHTPLIGIANLSDFLTSIGITIPFWRQAGGSVPHAR